MGTNYYLVGKSSVCGCCGHESKEPDRHIGKSSGGWCFSLHVYPEEGINTLNDWIGLFETGKILNEYGEEETKNDMVSIITERSWNKHPDTVFCTMNHAEPGPNNLARHKLGEYCIGHGEGTYDYIVGDFS